MTDHTPTDVIGRLNAALEGRYRIERELGAGGMATVYLAEDVRHDRKVAIKVLRPELAAVIGGERFVSEIKTTANLQHPHILPLHDSGEADGFLFYVMPFVEGESLREKLNREKQLPVDEALGITLKVAAALQAAHEKGIVHRDLKPANILLSGGEPLVADFGIALAVQEAGGGRLTETGLSLGTPFYMSPEQASADRQPTPASDVYSLGCVLYEMLIGDPPHTGSTAQAVLAKILTERPRTLSELRSTVPPHVAAATARALERLPADRFPSVQEFARALGDPGFTHVALPTASGTGPHPATVEARPPRGSRLPWLVAAAAVAVAALSFWPDPPPEPAPVVRAYLTGTEAQSTGGGGWRVVLSRDGQILVVGGPDDLLYVRRADDLEFRPLDGTRNARNPSLSPDGSWMVFTQGGELRRMMVAGGSILPVASPGGSAHWYAEDAIVFGTGGGVSRVAPAGGEPELLTSRVSGRPHMLPGGRALLGESGGDVYVVDLETDSATLIAEPGSNPRYLPTGHILYGDRSQQVVYSVPFDLTALEVTGPPVPVLPGVRIFSGGAVQLAVSDNGVLLYAGAVAAPGTGGSTFEWVALGGDRSSFPLEVSDAVNPRLSPDARRLAYQQRDDDRIYVLDLNTGARTLVADLAGAFPVWSPDGSSVYFLSFSAGGLYRASFDGSTEPERLALSDSLTGLISDISRDGEWFVLETLRTGEDEDLLLLRVDSTGLEPRPYLTADWDETAGRISPDGRWMVYVSDQTGDEEVFVRSFPEPGAPVQLSFGGGDDPLWAPDGSAIYFRSDSDSLVQTLIRADENLEVGESTSLFWLGDIRRSRFGHDIDIDPAGGRFMFVRREGGVDASDSGDALELVVVANWFEELRDRMGEGN
jgi:serine/threonine-protein kinase